MPALPDRTLRVWGRTAARFRPGCFQQLAPLTPFPLQTLYLGATVVFAAAGAAWLVDSKLGRVHADLRHFEGATTATLTHHSAQLAQLLQLARDKK